MSTIADLEVKQLEDHLTSGGFFAPFTDILGNNQPAPTFQSFELDLTNGTVDRNERVIMIRNSGNITASTRTFFKERFMLVLVVGRVGESDRVIVNGLAEDIEDYLVKNFSDGACIANIVSSGVSPTFITEDGRRAFEINITVMFNIIR